jgi:peptide deformylase
MIDKIKMYPNPVLELVSEAVDFGPKTKFLGQRLLNTLDIKDRLAVAAPQIGVSKRMFSYSFKGHDGTPEGMKKKDIVCNPSIIEFSEKTSRFREGCLSIPDLGYPEISRPATIVVQWFDVKGNQSVFELSGLQSRVFQHEIDHLDGILILDKVQEMRLAAQS